MPRSRSWTDEQLLAAIAIATTWSGVAGALGLKPGGGTHAVLRRHADRLGADTAHLPGLINGRPRVRRRFSDDDLRAAVESGATVADVLRHLGYQPSGGMHRFISAHIQRLNLDTSHFLGRAWARGKKMGGGLVARPLDEILIKDTRLAGSRILRRLINEGLKSHACEGCGRSEWMGQPIPLELDHINGVPTDNRIENLRALCPNCHALTPTYCGRNRGRVVEQAYTAALGAVASA